MEYNYNCIDFIDSVKIEECKAKFDHDFSRTALLQSPKRKNCFYLLETIKDGLDLHHAGDEDDLLSGKTSRPSICCCCLYDLKTLQCKHNTVIESLRVDTTSKGLIHPFTNELFVVNKDEILILDEIETKGSQNESELRIVDCIVKRNTTFGGGLGDAVFDDDAILHVLFQLTNSETTKDEHILTGGHHRVYDRATRVWNDKANLPKTASIQGGFINLCNGKNQLYHFGGKLEKGMIHQSFIYDCTNDKWIESVYLPCTFEEFTYVTNNKLLIVFGHYYYGGSMNQIYIFNLETIEWTKSKHQLPKGYGCQPGCMSLLIDNRILIFPHQDCSFIVTGTKATRKDEKHGQERLSCTPRTRTKIINNLDDNYGGNDNRNNHRFCSKWRYKQTFKRIMKFKSIYLCVVIHFSDVITDYLVLIQYMFYAYNEYFNREINYPNVDYLFVALVSFVTIGLNKILSSYYIWLFTQNVFDIILNLFDFYIFKEVIASHKSGNKTDLLAYLQKIERIFEASPQFAIQTYVLLRTPTEYTNSTTNEFIFFIQITSIFLSLYAISDKLISDDKLVFIESSGANKSWKPTLQWIYRVLFRLCEVVSNLILFVVVCTFYGVYITVMYLFYLIFVNFILFRNGLLGQNALNILAHLVAVMNLGITTTHNNNNAKSIKCISPMFQCLVKCIFEHNACNCYGKKCQKYNKYNRSLSFHLVSARIVLGLWVTLITIVLYYTTCNVNFDALYIIPANGTRYVNSMLMQFLLLLTFVCHLLQLGLFSLMFESMHLGVSLQRDSRSYILNYKFSDAVRLESIKKHGPNHVKIVKKVLNTIVNQNVPLLGTTTRDATKEQRNEHLYLISEINKLLRKHYTQTQEMLCDVLSNAIFHCHSTMIYLIITNKWIDNICSKTFNHTEKETQQKRRKNILLFIIENCSHRSDIMEMITMQLDECFDNNFNILLSDESNSISSYGANQSAIHELLSQNTQNGGEIIRYLSSKYWKVFFKCNVLKYVYVYEMDYVSQFIQFSFCQIIVFSTLIYAKLKLLQYVL